MKTKKKKIYITGSDNKRKIFEENFFILDSNNLKNVRAHMYGFSVSKNGILTDNYYKQLGEYKEPEPQGVYIMIRKLGNDIIINQDIYGSFGIYIYENNKTQYFALSNSFLLLEEYLIGKENMSFNKEFADNLILNSLCSFSIEETLIKEIKQIPSNAFIELNINKKSLKIKYLDFKENSIPLESKEGMKILDKWADKWGYILRSLKRKTDKISIDLSGGFDTRLVLSILINSGVNFNNIRINTALDKEHDHEIDFKIASNISSKFGFKLNNLQIENNGTVLNVKDTIYNTIYTKLGFHKEFYLSNMFLDKPRFDFSGFGGEFLRGVPGVSIDKYIIKMNFITHL